MSRWEGDQWQSGRKDSPGRMREMAKEISFRKQLLGSQSVGQHFFGGQMHFHRGCISDNLQIRYLNYDS